MQSVINDIAKILSELKHKARSFYTGFNELEIASQMMRYSEDEIKEMMDLKKIE